MDGASNIVAQGFERTRVGALNPEQTQKYMELVA